MKVSSAFKIFRRPLAAFRAHLRGVSHHDDSAARLSRDVARAIATEVLGSAPFDIESAFLSGRIPKGKSWPLSKLYVHTVATQHGSRWGIIEKRSNNLRELSAYQQAATASIAIMPKVYRIQRNSPLSLFEFRHHVYIEMFSQARVSTLSDAAAVRLAEHMIKIADIPNRQSIRPVRRRIGDLSQAFLKLVAKDPMLRDLAGDETLSRLPALVKDLSHRAPPEAPLVTCHNDLHAGNVGQRDDGSMGFFDWEQMGPNYLGSDLHHFMTSGLAHPDSWARFATVLCDEYAENAERSFGVPRQAIAVAANTFCIAKGMGRALRERNSAVTLSVVKHLDCVRQVGLEAFPDFGEKAADRSVVDNQPMPGIETASV